MSLGSTLVDVVTVTTPVVGTLAGGLLGAHLNHRAKARKRAEERTHEQRASERQDAADLRAEESALISAVLTSAAEWRRDVSATALAMRYSEQTRTRGTIDIDVMIQSHAAFGVALYAALMRFEQVGVETALNGCASVYQSAFDTVRDAVDPPAGSQVPAGNTLDGLAQTIGARMGQLQQAGRDYFTKRTEPTAVIASDVPRP